MQKTKFQVGDQIMPLAAKGSAVFPIFEIILIREFNGEECYICYLRQSIHANISPIQQIVPLNVEQDNLVIYSVDGEYTKTEDVV